MKDIIHQIGKECAEKLIEFFKEGNLYELDAMLTGATQITDDFAKKALQEAIAREDRKILCNKVKRKKEKMVVQERNVKRTVLWERWPFVYERTYYKQEKNYVFPVDEMLKIDSYERLTKGASASLINYGITTSFQKAANIVTNGAVSKQTVKNKVALCKDLAISPEPLKESPCTLHIFADEAHISMQQGKNKIIPLITIATGKTEVSKGRNELSNVLHISEPSFSPSKLWEVAYAACDKKYNMRNVKNVMIYGDGASWIKTGGDYFAGANFVLDAYHYHKRLTSLCGGEIGDKYKFPLMHCIKRDSLSDFKSVINAYITNIKETFNDGSDKRKKLKAIKKHGQYIINNWMAIRNLKHPLSIGSCTEGLISHTLASRVTRNPAGWSENGCKPVVMGRIYKLNGGEINASLLRELKHKKQGYDSLLKSSYEDNNLYYDWSIFGKTNDYSIAPSGTKRALDLLGEIKFSY